MKALVAGFTVGGSGFRGGGQLCGLDVGADGFVPRADAREKMRRHVIGMGGGRRDFGVHARGAEALLGEHRIVVAMNDVMRDSGMVRLFLEDGLENLATLALIG